MVKPKPNHVASEHDETRRDESQALFRSEYREELETWLRHRFRYLCITYLVIGIMTLLWGLLFTLDLSLGAQIISAAKWIIGLIAIGYYLFRCDFTGADRDRILQAATTMILIVGGLVLIGAFAEALVDKDAESGLILPLFVWHFSACLFLPWTPRESIRPFVPLLIFWAALALFFSPDTDWTWRILKVAFSPAILGPGLLIATWRMQTHSRSFRTRMVGKQFLTLRREFSQAREIHENMFPAPYDDGFVKFDFSYSPMRDLGGDFIHLHVGAEGLVHLTLIDVTGHGLAAALTVNRLYGELERIRAENPKAKPGQVITLLNRYIHLTMAKHTIYATGACVQFDPYHGELHWASGGHPPGYIRSVNGGLKDIEATTVVLGAVGDDQFDPDEQQTQLSPGDTLVLFTDGAFECRDRTGRQFGLARLRELMNLRPAPRHWPRFIASAVGKYSAGSPEDDILIASLTYLDSRQLPQEEPEPSLTAT